MMHFKYFAVFLLLVPVAAAQAPADTPVEVSGVNISGTPDEEVRVELGTTGSIPEATVVATYPDSLILDLPGAVYRALPRRTTVDRAGVRAVRIWMQSEDPPLTRVVVELDRTEQYLLSVEGNAVVLRVGPALPGISTAAPASTAETVGKRAATPAARGSAPAKVANALAGIFRRGPGKPAVSGSRNPNVWTGKPLPPDSASSQTAQSPNPSQSPSPQAEAAPTDTSATASVPTTDPNSPPTAPASSAAPANAANALAGIFRRGPGKPAVSGSRNPNIWSGKPLPPDSASSQTAQSASTPAAASLPDQSSPATELPSSAVPTDTKASSNPSFEPAGAQSPSNAQASSRPAVVSDSFPQPTVTVSPSETSSAPSDSAPREVTSSAVAPPDEATSVSPAAEAPQSVASSSLSESSPSAATETQPAGNSSTAAPPNETPETSSTSAAATPNAAGDLNAVAIVANPGMRTEFHVKFVEQETAYLDGGRSAGLAEGMKLLVKNDKSATQAGANAEGASGPAAELVVVAVAETSAVTEIHLPKRDIVPGDLAYLSSADLQALVQQHALGTTRKYPAVISFSEGGDALDEEAHAFVPRPPMPSVNRAEGRFGFDYTGTKSNDASQMSSSSIGGIVMADFTRIGGTYWNFRGYWRGRLTSQAAASQPTLQDLINRTYHLNLTYENPNSRWLIGAGRLYLPWASSLDTLDGGYLAARTGHGTSLGLFGGSTPDPTSWNYNPDRHIGGAFFNAEGGSYDGVRYSSTSGLGKSFSTVPYSTTTATGTTQSSYQDNRPFAFFENSISYNRTFSIFHALQVDQPGANPAMASPGAGLSRSFLTMRLQPFSRIEFSANHTYFRDVPTFDPQLVGTGLLDKYLFQGFSGGVRVEVVKNIALYTDLGRSSRTGDAKTSLNQMYGITFMNVPRLHLHADAHYSRFTSSFGAGTYRAFSLSRSLGDEFHFELLAGDQVFTSSLAGNQNAKFFTTNMDTPLGPLFFLQGGVTFYRGQLQNYNQWILTLGYRFDNKWRRK
jgi:AMIN domain